MLQINLQPFASDALEDAMRLAQTKALNSYSFSDCLNYMNYTWSDIYMKMAELDEGFYSCTVRITDRLTKLPPFVRSTVKIYRAQHPVGFDREIFRESGYNDLNAGKTYHISGFDLYCPDAPRSTVWLNYVPVAPMIFFTRNNRDPKIHETYIKPQPTLVYNMYMLETRPRDPPDPHDPDAVDYWLKYRGPVETPGEKDIKITNTFIKENYHIRFYECDYPYIFVTYQHKITEEYLSGFFKGIPNRAEWIEYNPFAYTGRGSNVEYLHCRWNDKTGMGVVIKDHNDGNKVKELGWTPDTLLIYPCPEMYRLFVARLADKFAAMNESQVAAVSKELIEASYAFNNYISKDKSSWRRIDNVNGPYIGDYL